MPSPRAAREEFVLAKLRREEEEGLYIIRWSVLDFNRLILSVAKRGQQQVLPWPWCVPTGVWGAATSHPEPPLTPQAPGAPRALKYRQFRIQRKGDSFVLEGWEREFPTLRELLEALKGCTLRSGHESFTVKRCCPPKPGGTRTGPPVALQPSGSRCVTVRLPPPRAEISDLLIARKAKDDEKQILNLTQLSFHQIRKNEITQVGCSLLPAAGPDGAVVGQNVSGGSGWVSHGSRQLSGRSGGVGGGSVMGQITSCGSEWVGCGSERWLWVKSQAGGSRCPHLVPRGEGEKGRSGGGFVPSDAWREGRKSQVTVARLKITLPTCSEPTWGRAPAPTSTTEC